MATKKRIDLEFLFSTLHLPSLSRNGKTRHQVTVELIYPRTTVALKSIVKTFELTAGICDATALSWTQRICFKETVEGNFGLRVSISEKQTATEVRKAARYMAGKSLKVGADALEDAIPVPVVDEIAKLPLLYASQSLLGTVTPKIIAEGILDLHADDFAANVSASIQVPLHSVRKMESRKKVILKVDDPDGSASFTVTPLE